MARWWSQSNLRWPVTLSMCDFGAGPMASTVYRRVERSYRDACWECTSEGKAAYIPGSPLVSASFQHRAQCTWAFPVMLPWLQARSVHPHLKINQLGSSFCRLLLLAVSPSRHHHWSSKRSWPGRRTPML